MKVNFQAEERHLIFPNHQHFSRHRHFHNGEGSKQGIPWGLWVTEVPYRRKQKPILVGWQEEGLPCLFCCGGNTLKRAAGKWYIWYLKSAKSFWNCTLSHPPVSHSTLDFLQAFLSRKGRHLQMSFQSTLYPQFLQMKWTINPNPIPNSISSLEWTSEPNPRPCSSTFSK